MDNKNLIIGSIALIIVIIVGVLIFAPKGEQKDYVTEDLDEVKVYIHHEKTDDEDGYYSACSVDTENLLKIKNEFDKALKLEDSALSETSSINGEYKVIVDDDEFIAFDNDDSNTIYISTKNDLYTFESDIYDLVVNTCK